MTFGAEIPAELEDFIDLKGVGEHMEEEYAGKFVEGGFVYNNEKHIRGRPCRSVFGRKGNEHRRSGLANFAKSICRVSACGEPVQSACAHRLCLLRGQGVFPKHQARRDIARADVGRISVYVLRAERICGRVHAMDETGRGALPHGVHADDIAFFGAYDVYRKYAARPRRHACGERGAAHRAAVRAGQFGKVQSHERGTRHDDGDQPFENGRSGRQVRKTA